MKVPPKIPSANYWAEVCAPKLKAVQEKNGPSQEILADFVRNATGKPSERPAIGHFLSGEREPYISQFLALCERLNLDPLVVLEPPTPPRQAAIQTGEKVTGERKPYGKKSRPGTAR